MNPHARIVRARGSALLLGLLILIVLTLLGIVAASNSVIEERLTGTYRDMITAQESAEDALRDMEYKLLLLDRTPGRRQFGTGALESGTGCAATGTACSTGGSVIPDHFFGEIGGTLATQPESWWLANGTPYGLDPVSGTLAAPPVPNVADQPVTYPEFLTFDPDDFGDSGSPRGIKYYRIASMGFGAQPDNSALLESTFAVSVSAN